MTYTSVPSKQKIILEELRILTDVLFATAAKRTLEIFYHQENTASEKHLASGVTIYRILTLLMTMANLDLRPVPMPSPP